MNIKYTLHDIRKAQKEIEPWWVVFVIDPIAIRILWFIANFTNFKPNSITFISTVFTLVSAGFFALGDKYFVITGGILFMIGYTFDCVDGKLARLLNIKSSLGGLYDKTSDRWTVFIATVGLIYGQYSNNPNPAYLWLGILFIFAKLSYLIAIEHTNGINALYTKKAESGGTNYAGSRLEKLRDILKKKRLTMFPGVEADVIVFLIAPMLGFVMTGLIIGTTILLLVEVAKYTIAIKKLKTIGTNN